MQPHNEFRFHPQVVQIGCYLGEAGHTEVYLLEGDSLALIDTGTNSMPAAFIAPALAVYGRALADVEIVLNTHGHYDHAGGNGALVDTSGAQVYLHEADVAIAQDPNLEFDTYFGRSKILAGQRERLDAVRAAWMAKAARPATKVDRKLKDGDQLDLGKGIRLSVLHTPGHTRGSVCYYWEKAGFVFAGDSIPGLPGPTRGLPLIFSATDMERTVDRLLTLDISTLALGHHYRTPALPGDSIHFGENAKAYVRQCRKIANIIEASLRQAASAMPEASFLEVARAATDLLCEQLPIVKDADGLPEFASLDALYSYWQLLK